MSRTVAIYARVSTTSQDPQRQLDQAREYVNQEYSESNIQEYVDIVSGTATSSEEYDRLVEDIDNGEVDRVVVDEISRLSRLGGGEVLEFIQHCLDNDTSVEDREVGLTIDVTDDIVDQAVTELLVGVMGQLAKIEHKQKLRRIRSGIRAAKDAGKWTGRPPVGFEADEDGYLRVKPEEFLRVREAVERVTAGEPTTAVAEDLGIARSTLANITSDRRELYLHGEADDDRVSEAVSELTPLPGTDATIEESGNLRQRVEELEEQISDINSSRD